VPRNAINDGPTGSYVYVVSDGKAVAHAVKILFDDTKNVAVESDIRRGDRIIVEGQLRVDPDGPVRILPPAKSAGSDSASPKRKSGHRH
jgi:multidrug efflux pump subunit AcrA (membrane-fusion protein)